MANLDRSLITDLPMFAGVGGDRLDEILNEAQSLRYAKGTNVFEQDAPATSFFILLDGHLRVAKLTPAGQQVVVRFVAPGEIFGVAKAIGRTTYPATATAVVDSVALVWPSAAWPRLIEKNPALATNALQTIGSRLQEAHTRVVERPAFRRQCRHLHECPRYRLQLGVLPRRSANLRPMGIDRSGPALLGTRAVLRLVVPVRRPPGAPEQPRAVAQGTSGEGALGPSRAAVAGQVHHLSRPFRVVPVLGRTHRGARGGGALQDGDHPQIRPRMAICGLCPNAARGRPVHRALLLPLPLPSRRGARHPGPNTDVRVAQALAGLRIAVPALRERVPRPVDPPRGLHQRQRVHLLHALSGTLPRRPALSAHDSGATEAREALGAFVALNALDQRPGRRTR